MDTYAGIQIQPDLPPPVEVEEVLPEEAVEAEVDLDTDRFTEMLRAAAAAAGSEPGKTA
jgi:hypothetical protein